MYIYFKLIGMKKNATVKIVLDPQSNEAVRTVKLRITFNRVTRFRAIPSEIKLYIISEH